MAEGRLAPEVCVSEPESVLGEPVRDLGDLEGEDAGVDVWTGAESSEEDLLVFAEPFDAPTPAPIAIATTAKSNTTIRIHQVLLRKAQYLRR